MVERLDARGGLRLLASLHVEIGILAFCGLIFAGTGRTDGPVFDVVGPDLLPTATAGIVAVLVLLQVVVQVVGFARTSMPALRIDPLALRNSLVFIPACGLFVLVVAQGWMPFALATCFFMAINTVLLSNRLLWRDAAVGAASGLALGVVLQFTFTRILFIDLPG